MQPFRFETQVSKTQTSDIARKATKRLALMGVGNTGTSKMGLVSWRWGGNHHAGTLSAWGRELTPLELPQPERDALGLLQRLAQRECLPRARGRRPPRGFKHGCVMRVEIKALGAVENRFV